MERIARVVPIKSRSALLELCDEIRAKSDQEKKAFMDTFGTGCERWYFQEIDGKPHLISVTEGTNLTNGYSLYESSNDPFFEWFSQRVQDISDIDLRKNPTGAVSELVFEMGNQ